MMDDKDLLDVLKTEMLLAAARAEGAKAAYEHKAVRVASRECKFARNNKILIRFRDCEKVAYFDHIQWSSWEIPDYQGPAIYGWSALKNGKKSKTYGVLCTIEMLRAGRVKVCDGRD